MYREVRPARSDEPIDNKASHWHAVPNGGCLTVVPGEPLRMSCMQTAVAAAA
jgi:hypothetical protein